MPISVANMAVPYSVNSQMVTSVTATWTNSGREINTKNRINEIIVKTRIKMPMKRPLWARAQSTE